MEVSYINDMYLSLESFEKLFEFHYDLYNLKYFVKIKRALVDMKKKKI